MTRQLIYVPILHNPFAGEIVFSTEMDERLAAIDPSLRQEFIQEQTNYWDEIDNYLAKQSVDRVYHDTVSQETMNTSIEFLDSGNFGLSRNFTAVRRLRESGSKLMVTEFNGLSNRYILDDLPRRDRYIADRIGETLQDNETGVLFIGAGHDITRKLSETYKDIIIYRPNFDLSRLVGAYKAICLQISPEEANSIEELLKPTLGN